MVEEFGSDVSIRTMCYKDTKPCEFLFSIGEKLILLKHYLRFSLIIKGFLN